MEKSVTIDEWGNVVIKDGDSLHFSHISDYTQAEQRELEERAFDY